MGLIFEHDASTEMIVIGSGLIVRAEPRRSEGFREKVVAGRLSQSYLFSILWTILSLETAENRAAQEELGNWRIRLKECAPRCLRSWGRGESWMNGRPR